MKDKEPPASVVDPVVAYRDQDFLDSDDARPLRIVSEYLAPLRALRQQQVRDTIVFFGSARIQSGGPLGRYYDEARALARDITAWSMTLEGSAHRRIVCSGGGPGIMEAANRGARDAGGRTVGFNIGLPHEQKPNPYITPGLSFQFHYFFMRKLWFAHTACALVAFPGGFGTLDEMFEILTLQQTAKLDRQITMLLYGSEYWREIIDFEALVRHGTIAREDLDLFTFVDDPASALKVLKAGLAPTSPRKRSGEPAPAATPAFAPSRLPHGDGDL
ncbi:MAG TPA: TIGR00730 family Rossman fold protein [Polyangia bacterium]|nr:TIGR00730 family Rossman fold protein [Polyangia bacterium]